MKKLFRVYERNDYGKPIRYLGVFKADDEMDARMIASEFYQNKEILTTGFYGAKEITNEQLVVEKADAMTAFLDEMEGRFSLKN